MLGLLDKLVFGSGLLVFMQVPQFVEHYGQYLNGYFTATEEQVQGYATTAAKHQFADTEAMITAHLDNSSASVRDDAVQKQTTLAAFEDAKQGVALFEQGGLFEKLRYMLTPARLDSIKQTLANFSLGVPLTAVGLGFGVVGGLFSSLLLISPLKWLFRRKSKRATKPVYYGKA